MEHLLQRLYGVDAPEYVHLNFLYKILEL